MSTDPLLRAIASGDRNCPDGEHLARLGELTRAASVPAASDLRDRVLTALADADADTGTTADDLDAIDALVEGTPSDPALMRLRDVVRAQRPRPADLRERVRRAIAPASIRMTVQQAEATGRRWRIIAAIAAAHVAAILLVTAVVGQTPATGSGADTTQGSAQKLPIPGHEVNAASWDELRSAGGDLIALRRDPSAREAARAEAGLSASASAVGSCLAWLIAHQDPVSGRIGSSASGDRAVAIQAFAALALFGEGGGDQTRLVRARLALGPIAAAMAGSEPLSSTTLGTATLALVEGALVTGDAEVRLQAQAALLRLVREMPGHPGEGGLAGLGWLALEAAATGGIDAPRGAVEAARERIARPLPGDGSHASGRIGLAAYARLILGQRRQEPTRAQLDVLLATPPANDASGRADPLTWFFSGMAVREDSTVAWRAWANELGRTLLPHIVPAGPGMALVPAAAVRFADGPDGDILATSTTLLALQVPYRYVALARE